MNLVPAINIAIVGCFALLYLLSARKRRNPYPAADPTKWVLYACMYWCISYLMTTAPLSNFFSFDFLRRDGNIFFAYLPLVWIGSYGLTQNHVRQLVHAYLAVMSLLAAIGAVQFAAGVGLLPNFLPLIPDSLLMVSPGETSGLEFHAMIQAHNAAGGAYAIAAVLALSVLLFSERRPQLRSWPAAWLVLCLLGLAMTKSRGSYLGFSATAALMFLGSKADLKRAIKPLAFVMIPILGALLMVPQILDRVTAIGSGEADPNIVIRLITWPRAIDYIVSSPIVGIGLGRFNDENLQFYGVPNVVYVATGGEIVNNDAHAHNSFLHFAAEGGTIGLVLMVGIWVSVYRWSKWASSQLPRGTLGYALARAVCSCVILECLIAMTDHMMASAVTTIAIFTLFGLLRNLVDCPEVRKSIAFADQRRSKHVPPAIAGPVGPALGTAN